MTEAKRKEKINELMNKISFALKDDILAQGLEIICKRISELEKENKIKEEIIIGEQAEIDSLKKGNADLKERIEKMKTLFEIIKNRSYTINIYNIAVEGIKLAE